MLPANDVQALSMIIHELATNAVKYGSLSQAEGKLAVTWERLPGRAVRLVWREDGPSEIEAPREGGFGSRLIGQLMGQLRGGVRYEWRPSGLLAELMFTPTDDPDAPQ